MITEDTIPNNKIHINHINESKLTQRFLKNPQLKSKNIYYDIIKQRED